MEVLTHQTSAIILVQGTKHWKREKKDVGGVDFSAFSPLFTLDIMHGGGGGEGNLSAAVSLQNVLTFFQKRTPCACF